MPAVSVVDRSVDGVEEVENLVESVCDVDVRCSFLLLLLLLLFLFLRRLLVFLAA